MNRNQPLPVYDSAQHRSPIITEFNELLNYRGLLRQYISQSIKTRYKRSALGVVWTLLNPLLNMAVLTIAFSTLFRFSLKNYPIYLLAGLIFWNFFSQTTMTAMDKLIWGGGILKRIYIPRTIFSVSEVGTGLVNLFLALIPLAFIMLVMGHPFRPALLFLPVSILIISLFTLGVALLFSTLAVFFVDVVEMYKVLLSVWFYLTPIIYPVEIIPKKFLKYLNFNPMNSLIELFRAPIYLGILPELNTIITASILGVASSLVGWVVFTRKVDELAFRI
jgi:ABC-type polysaccharide/polyol phosphate export permease